MEEYTILKNRIYILAILILALTANAFARVFTDDEVIFVKVAPDNWNWYGSDPATGKFAYFYNEGTLLSEWSVEAVGVDYCSDILQITVPDGDWTHVILTRNTVHSAPDWSNVVNNGTEDVNQTHDIEIHATQNYLENFRQKKDGGYDKWFWNDYFVKPTDDPAANNIILSAEKTTIEVCKQSSGDPYSLQPKLKDDLSGYDYEQGHQWFKWTGSAWKAMKYGVKWGYDYPGGLNETIGAENTHTYYFLSTKDADKRRFIDIFVIKDCQPTCKITDFGVVTSSVNAHDSTYVLDGIVAFGDADGNTLRISVTDIKGEHYIDYVNPETPLIFSLPDLYADGAKDVIATASFLLTPYVSYASFDAPDAIKGISTISLSKTPATSSTTFTPPTPGTDGFIWHDDNTTDHERVIPAYKFDTTVIYTYYEYEKAPEVSGDLINNGDFTSTSFDYGTTNYNSDVTIPPFSTISQYHYWGKDITSASDFYILNGNISGGMSIVQDANAFWQRFTKKIISKRGNHFALFDADNSGSKNAWIVETDATQPKLKLAKGTNYMFSFWVANINNYGEMNNAAILQFEISYSTDGGTTWSTPEQLGNPIDLNDYLDNLWHQNSYVYTSTVDASNVRISVRDLNMNANPGGNDFALDDIRFQPISVVTQAIKHCQRFVLKLFEPSTTVDVPQITIKQTPSCGKNDYTVDVKVSYSTLPTYYPVTLTLTDDIYGTLIASQTIDPLLNPDNITVTLKTSTYPSMVADGKLHTLTAKITRLDEKNIDKGGSNSNTFTAPGVPAIHTPILTEQNKACDKTTFDLQVETEYIAFKGTKLHYDWDGTEWLDADNPSLSYNETTPQTAIGKLKNLTADGNKHSLRVYSDNTTLDCEYIFSGPTAVTAPHIPAITSVTAAAVPGSQTCSSKLYDATVTVAYDNKYGNLIIDDGDGHSVSLTEAQLTTNPYTHTFNGITTAAGTRTFNVYFSTATDCKKSDSFTEPVRPVLGAVTAYPQTPSCSKSTFTCEGSFTFEYPAGDLIITDVESGESQTITSPVSPQNYSISNITADGLGHHIQARFSGDATDCYVEYAYTAPLAPAINNVKAAVVDGSDACNSKLYDASVTVTYENPHGNLIITDGDGHYASIPESALTTNPYTHTFTNIERKGTTRTFSVYFSTATDCKMSDSFTEPVRPLYKTLTAVPQTPSCTSAAFDCKGTVTFEDGVGSLVFTDVESGKSTTLATYYSPQSYTVGGIPADGKAHTIRAHFSGDESTCFIEQTYTAPKAPVISEVTATPLTDLVCGENKYNAEVKVTYDNPLGSLVITDDDGHIITVPQADLAGLTTYTQNFNDIVTKNGTRTFRAYFSTASDCERSDSYTEPVEPRISGVSVATIDGPCNTGTYDIKLTVSFINQDGTLHADVDGANEVTLAQTDYPAGDPALRNAQLTITGLTADGKNHVYNIWFDGPHGCAKMAQNFKASHIPVISATTATVEPYACGDANYSVTVTADYSNTQGKNLVVTDGTTKNTQIIATTTDADSKTVTFTSMPMAAAPGITHTFHAYIQGYDECKNETSNTATYTVPATPQIKASATRSPLVVDCSTTSLTYAVTVNYTNQNGNIKVRWDGGTDIVKPIDATYENDNTPHNMVVNLPAITPDGMTHTYIVETDGTHACQIANSVNAPLVTAVKNVKATVTEPAFGEDKYDLTVTAQFTNGSGHLITVECPSLSIAHTETAPAGGNFSYTFTDITTDNNIEHDVNVFFNETPACIASATFRSPVAKSFTAFTTTAELRNCNTGFVVNFNGAFSHLTGNIIVHDLTDNVELYNQPAPTGYSFSGTSMVISSATPGTHTLEAWFTSDPTHRRQTTIEVPALAQLTPIVTMGAANCNGTVTAHVDVTFANYAGDLVLADENNSTLTTFSHPDPNITHSYDWILPADGNAHTLRAYFTSMPACAQTVDITTPLAPTVTIVKNTALSSLKCDGTYSYYYDINFANSTGNLLAQKAGDLTPQNLGSTGVRWLVEGMQTNAATKSIAQVWLSDFPDCKYDITETFPDAVSFNITSTIGDLQCDGTFNFNATVNFKGATTGALVILDEFGKEITRDNSPVSPFNFSYNLPADGYAHTIQAYFTDATECFGGGAITAPMAMTVNSLSETHSAVYCTETAYELYLTVETTNPQHDIIISEGATELARIPVTPVMGDATYYTTLNLDTDLKPHTLKAWFDGCPAGSVQTLTYTAPAPNECIHYYDSICQGQSFKGHGLTLGPQNDLGDFNYQVLDSTIHLHVMQEPKFSVLRSEPACNTSAEILLPISVTQGEPDRYNISFTDAIFNNLINKPLTDGFIHIPIPAGVQAGTYAATVTLYAKGSSFAIGQRCEARVNTSFDIAQDGLLYSKWQDVLLVNNVNDEFVGYQWYKNNILLEGETQQRLYNPNGLEGRYYCLLTRTDGTKIKTCVMEFDEAPRSAELLSKTQVQPHYLRQGEPLTIIRTHSGNATVSFYSVTGHCVLTATVLEQEETVRIPDDIGLFIVVIDDDNERTTEKIIIE